MAYTSLTLQLLISAPTDVPSGDLATIHRTIGQWNVMYGKIAGITVVPLSWSDHAVSEFGQRPQGVINEQLVDNADMVLALFADRLGTPTGQSESGTAEEIERMAGAGKHVSVLRNMCPRPPLSGPAAVNEKSRLEKWLGDIRDKRSFCRIGPTAS